MALDQQRLPMAHTVNFHFQIEQEDIPMKYIAYGSNMSVEQMETRCPDARLIGTGHIEGAQLEFYVHATVERARIKCNRSSAPTRVPVAVWEISRNDELRLDSYEGVPAYYIKEEWPVTMEDGTVITGMIYLMQAKRPGAPTADYYNGIRAAYEDLGLSSEIRTALEPALDRAPASAHLCRFRRG
jgi:gamma-glutamylcyclotransferase (GGCT)/AIG2-like uncharacterized protein YtfP